MKAKSKYLYAPIAIVVFMVIGFLIKKETNEQSVYNVIWGIYSPILTIFGAIIAITIIVWFTKQRIRPKKKGIKEIFGPTTQLKEKKHPLLLRLTPIIFGWMVFILSILELHPQLWKVWYGDGGLGFPLFWIAQALFVLLLLLFHSYKSLFYSIITIAVAMSFWYGFSEKLSENGLLKEKIVHIVAITQKKWRMCWSETVITRKHPGKVKEPCSKNTKQILLLVDIKKYDPMYFVFTVSWKKNGIMKERSTFYWNKGKSIKGRWDRNGSSTKDFGDWYLEKINGDLFSGKITSDSDGSVHPFVLYALN